MPLIWLLLRIRRRHISRLLRSHRSTRLSQLLLHKKTSSLVLKRKNTNLKRSSRIPTQPKRCLWALELSAPTSWVKKPSKCQSTLQQETVFRVNKTRSLASQLAMVISILEPPMPRHSLLRRSWLSIAEQSRSKARWKITKMRKSRHSSPSRLETLSKLVKLPSTLSLATMLRVCGLARGDSTSSRHFSVFLTNAGPDATSLPSLRR